MKKTGLKDSQTNWSDSSFLLMWNTLRLIICKIPINVNIISYAQNHIFFNGDMVPFYLKINTENRNYQ